MKTRCFFITGTGTDVGKTVVTAGIAASAIAAGLRVAVIKPVQTGTDDYASDPDVIARLVPDLVRLPPELEIPFRFRLAASPHLAAEREGRIIRMDEVAAVCRRAAESASADVVLFEGAGGLMVPLNRNDTMLDLIRELGIPVILAADAGLGGINHAMLSIMAMREAGITMAGVVLNRFRGGDLIHEDNRRTIAALSGLPILAVIPPLELPLTPAVIGDVFSGVWATLNR